MAINKYNFLRWSLPDETESGMPKPYRIESACYAPVMVPGETTSFYINVVFVQDFNATVRILRSGTPVSSPLTLTKVESETGIEFYGSIVCPELAKGIYNLGFYVDGVLKLTSSNLIIITSGYEKNTALVRFRHDRVLYGFNYDLDPEFYQQFRIHLSETDRQYDYNKDQYRSEISGNLRNFYSTTDRFVKFETYYFDDGAHEAAAAMVDHDEVYINNERFIFKKGYEQETDIRSSISKGNFEMWEWQFSSDNRKDNTNEVIIPGLSFSNVEMSQVFTRNNCASGFTGSSVTYTVAAGTYTSIESQDAANELAQDDIDTNGQAYANSNGTCEPSYYVDADGEIFTDADGEGFY